MQANLIDRAIAAFAPARALSRLKARAQLGALGQMAAYSAETMGGSGVPSFSATGRFNFAPRGRDAVSDTLRGLPNDRAKSRFLARNSLIAAGAINTNVDRVVGTGLALSAQPNASALGWSSEQALEWKRAVQAEFSLWSDGVDCDHSAQQNFYELQALVLRATLESGDCFTLLPNANTASASQPYQLRLQVLEADCVGNPQGQIDQPDLSGGIRFESGAPTAYFVYRAHPGAATIQGERFTGDWVQRVGNSGRLRILHHFRKLRPGQPRGLPYLAPIVDAVQQISRYTEAEIMAAVISAYFTILVETESGDTNPVFGAGASDTASSANAFSPDFQMGPGAVLGLAKGEKASFADPSRPNANFGAFIDAVVKQMGMALGLPHELLVKQFNASYSASKAALLDAWVYFRGVRTWLSRSFCQPVYETWLAEAVASGRISAAGFFTDPLLRWAYTRAAWHGDSMGSINPKDEISAYVSAIDARLMTREKAEWELFGSDFNDTYEQKLAEYTRLKADGMLPTPKAGAAAPVETTDDAPEGKDEAKNEKPDDEPA